MTNVALDLGCYKIQAKFKISVELNKYNHHKSVYYSLIILESEA